MKIRFSAHGACHHQYHVVWIPKYRKNAVEFQVSIWVLHFKCIGRKPVGIYFEHRRTGKVWGIKVK